MSSQKQRSGSCLCNTVSFTASSESSVGACNCNMCRKWNGGPQMAVPCGNTVKFSGEKNIATYKSSEWAERGFCKQCGSHLFYRFHGDQYMMLVGLFDSSNDFVFDTQYFIDQKPGFYSFENDTNNLTGEQVAKMMGLG